MECRVVSVECTVWSVECGPLGVRCEVEGGVECRRYKVDWGDSGVVMDLLPPALRAVVKILPMRASAR